MNRPPKEIVKQISVSFHHFHRFIFCVACLLPVLSGRLDLSRPEPTPPLFPPRLHSKVPHNMTKMKRTDPIPVMAMSKTGN